MTLTDNNDELIFQEDEVEEKSARINPWKMMIVDDVADIHHVTRMIFEDYAFDGRHLQFLSAYSGQEARQLMAEHPDTAVILLDVVMETDHAGLDVVRYIREDLQNGFVRIILRTGQPGQAPEKKVIIEYDINDYKTKEELTSNKLFTAVTSALRSCRDMNVIERNRKGLEMIINASSSLLKLPSLKQFTSGVLTQLTSILGFEDNSLLLQTADGTCGFAATAAQGNYKIIAGTGHYEKYVNQCVTDLDNENVMEDINQAIRQKMNNFKDKSVVCYFKTNNDIENILYLQSRKIVNKTDRNMIDIFLSNVAIAFDNLYHRENLEKLVEERTSDLKREKETVAKAHKVLSKYVPPQLTARILAGEIEDVWESSRKRLTMFFSDIKDFTKLTESMEPEDLAKLLNGYFTEMNDIANHYGGVVVDFTGDGLFVFFGAPDATTDREHALNCVHMAIAMQRRIVDLGKKWFEEGIEEPLQNRCGINTGMVNVGGFGSAERKKYGAQGVHVNLASRLEAACEPGQILISHSTWALVKDDIVCEPKGKLEVKGLSHSVRVYNVCLNKTDGKADLL